MKLLIFIVFIIVARATLFPNIIWMYLDNGQDNVDSVASACVSRIKQINIDWEVRVLQNITIKLWLSQTQMVQLQKLKQKSLIQITPKAFSSFLRLFLLKKYGGVWLDTYTIMLQNLDWIQNLKTNSEVLNKFGEEPEAFVFFKNDKSQVGFYDSFQNQSRKLYPTISIQANLIASLPHSWYIMDLFGQLTRLHLYGKKYFNKVQNEYNFNQQYTQYWTLELANVIIRYKQLRLYQQAVNQNSATLQNAFYNVWAINRLKGPYYHTVEQEGSTNVNCLFRNIEQTYHQPKYLIKLSEQGERQKVFFYLLNQQYQVDYQMRKSNEFIFDYGEMYVPDSLQCLYKAFVFQNSIVNHYIIQGNSIPYFSVKKVYKNSQLPWICRQTHLQNIYNMKNKVLDFLYIVVFFIVFIQFFIQITIKLTKLGIQLEEQKLSIANKEKAKQDTFFVCILGYAIVLQYYYVKSELMMWLYDSPYSYFIVFLEVVITLFILSYSSISRVYIYGFKFTLQRFVLLALLICFFEFFTIKLFGIWNSTYPLFHFQTLMKMNKQNLGNMISGLWKLLLLYIIGKFYFVVKKYASQKGQKIGDKIKNCLKKSNQTLKRFYIKYTSGIKQSILKSQQSQQQEVGFVQETRE